MKVNDKHLYIGAVLSMIGSFLIVIAHNQLLGNVVFFFSNTLLLWYTYCTIDEFFRIMMKATDEVSPDKE